MADGTLLNDLFVPRLHKSNAEHTVDENADMLAFYRDRLLILAASTPVRIDDEAWADYVHREVPTLIDELRDCAIREYLAQYVMDNPEDCQDELVDADWPKE